MAERARGIPAPTVEKSLAHSLRFALLDGDRLVGFARVIPDHATIAYLGDVFVLPVPPPRRPEIFMERHDPNVYDADA